jgi:hypothetical protein
MIKSLSVEEDQTQQTMDVPCATSQSSDPKINKLSLEMFMNNNYYSKYLSKSDPIKYQEFHTFQNNAKKHKKTILEMTKDIIENPDKLINPIIHDKYHEYVNACIKYLEMKELDEKAEQADNIYGDEVEDAISDHEMLIDHDSEEELPQISPFPKSFWGPAIARMDEEKSLLCNQPARESTKRTLHKGTSSLMKMDIRAFSQKR